MKQPEIIYEDPHILVCHKPAGIPTQTARTSAADLVSILKNEICRTSGVRKPPYLAVIHRLDQPVEGLLVFAKTKEAAAKLSAQLQKDDFSKDYLALLKGDFTEAHEASGTLVNYLVKDAKTNTSRIADPSENGAKKAVLHYEVLEGQHTQNATLVCIHLETGRHHQIRVQTAATGHPIIGDHKYGAPEALCVSEALCVPDSAASTTQLPQLRFPALCAYHLAFRHPATGKPMEFKIRPEWL